MYAKIPPQYAEAPTRETIMVFARCNLGLIKPGLKKCCFYNWLPKPYGIWVVVYCCFYSCWSQPQNISVLQNDTVIGSLPVMTSEVFLDNYELHGSGYGGSLFDEDYKPGPGGGYFSNLDSIVSLELLQIFVLIQDKLGYEFLSDSANRVWTLARRVLLIVLSKRTWWYTGSPLFTREEEKRANSQSNIVVTEFPIDPVKGREATPPESSSEAAVTDSGTSHLVKVSKAADRVQLQGEWDRPPAEWTQHDCYGKICAACDYKPCCCINCQRKRQPIKDQFQDQTQKKKGSNDNQINRQIRKEETILSDQVIAQHLMVAESEQETELNSILDISDIDILDVLPDGRLLVGSNVSFWNKIPHSILFPSFIKKCPILELSVPEVATSNWPLQATGISSSLLIARLGQYCKAVFLHQGDWQIEELGEFSEVVPLTDGRFITAPAVPSDSDIPVGMYKVWSMNQGTFASHTIGNADKRILTLLKESNRLVSKSDYSCKIWSEQENNWSYTELKTGKDKFESIRVLHELEEQQLLSVSAHGFGIWSQEAGVWNYNELMRDSASNYVYSFVFDKHRFITCDQDNSIKIWSKHSDEWLYNELDHLHQKSVRIHPLDHGRFVTSSTDSARIWEPLGDGYTSFQLTGFKGEITQVIVLSDGCLATWSSTDGIRVWYNNGLAWSSVFLRGDSDHLCRVGYHVDRIVELSGGYLAIVYRGLSYAHGLSARPLDSVVIWSLNLKENVDSPEETEHLQRIEQEGTVEYKPYFLRQN